MSYAIPLSFRLRQRLAYFLMKNPLLGGWLVDSQLKYESKSFCYQYLNFSNYVFWAPFKIQTYAMTLIFYVFYLTNFIFLSQTNPVGSLVGKGLEALLFSSLSIFLLSFFKRFIFVFLRSLDPLNSDKASTLEGNLKLLTQETQNKIVTWQIESGYLKSYHWSVLCFHQEIQDKIEIFHRNIEKNIEFSKLTGAHAQYQSHHDKKSLSKKLNKGQSNLIKSRL